MKLTKLSLLFSIGVMLAIAATGCKNPKYGVTPLGDRAATSGSGQGQLPGGGMLPPGENPQSQPGFGGGEAATFNPDDFNQDRAALAAQTVYFDYDSSSIRPSEQSKLDAVVAALSADASAKLLVEGHCDERGTEEYNRSLGERRALAAREVLAAHGLSASRVATRSFGEDRPANSGHDESAWSKNRRDEFVLLHPR